MPVRFNGPNGVESLVPAPLVDIQKQYVRGPNGLLDHVDYVFTLTGTIVNVDTPLDSPAADGLTGMEGILAEQSRIRNLFRTEGGRLEIESPGGGGPNTIDAYCLVDSINFSSGVWVNRCDYTIVLRARAIEGDEEISSELESFGETWSVTENEDGTFTITHQLSARGALIYTELGANTPLDAAREWVYNRMYLINTDGTYTIRDIDSMDFDPADLITGVGLTEANFWNKAIVENVDPTTYGWSVTETFIFNNSGNYVEEWSASFSFDQDNPRRGVVTISGSINGFADNASNRDLRLTNAKTAFDTVVQPALYTRLLPYVPSGFTLNPVAVAKQYSFEPPGIVRYGFTYGTTNTTIIPNAIEEDITVSDAGTTDIFAQIPIPGRAYGPVVQNMSTVTLPERTVSITAIISSSGIGTSGTGITLASLLSEYLSKPNTDDIINELKPSAGYYYIKQDTEEWNPIRRQYGRTVSWVLQTEGATVAGIPSGVRNLP